MKPNYSNLALPTTLAAPVNAGALSLTVASAAGYPEAPFRIRVGDEVMMVGARAGTTFSALTRGADGTTAAAHTTGEGVTHVVSAEDFRVIESEYPLLAGSWYGPPPGLAAQKAFARNALYSLGVRVPAPCTLSEIGWFVDSTSTAGSLRFGAFYFDHGTRLFTRVAELGVAAVGSGGFKSLTGLSVKLRAGLVYLVAQIEGFTADPVMYYQNGPPAGGMAMPQGQVWDSAYYAYGWPGRTGALPATLPSPTPTYDYPQIRFKVTYP